MKHHICETCGTQYAASDLPPARCPICEDERQYVGWSGQRWTDHDALLERHRLRIGEDEGLLALEIEGDFAIDQRALLLPTDAGNILWETLSLVTNQALEALRARGGVDRIVISHPHFFAAMGQWSDALGGVPILLHEANRPWVQHDHPAIAYWSGERLRLSDDVQLVRGGGHFPGSTVLHWAAGPRPGGALFAGDTLQVVPSRRHVSFMYSYPNLIPMRPSSVMALRRRLADLSYEDVYGYAWGRNIIGGGDAAVRDSFDRYLTAIGAPDPASSVRLLVFGATGQVGSRVVAEAARRGHRVTAAVRSAEDRERLPRGVASVVLDARDRDRVAEVIAEHELTVSALRPPDGHEGAMVELTRSVLDGAGQSQRRVLIAGGAANLLVPDGSGHTVLTAPGLLPEEARPVAEASFAQYMACVNHPDADWVYFSPAAMLGPGERTGTYRRGGDVMLVDEAGESAISFEDYAVAMVDEIERPAENVRRITVAQA